MARPREFDEDEVIARALAAFWAHGYDATSVADLMESTGLAKGSIYKGFGDKKQLFMAALESYLATGTDGLEEIEATSETGREALERVLFGVAEMATRRGTRCGCLAVNSAVELGPHDSEVRARLRRYTRQKENRLAAIIQRGMDDGSLRPGLAPAASARYITMIADGLQVQGKLGLTKNQANEAVDIALAPLV